VKIKLLLQRHFEVELQEALPENWGDVYLLKHNQIYRQIRRLTLQNRFAYTSNLNEAFSALPLGDLDSFLGKKQIPYLNNVQAIKELEAKRPNQIEWDHIVDNLHKNHVFHESCHAVARSIVRPAAWSVLNISDFSLDDGSKESRQQKMGLILLEESFANACELLAVADVDDSAHKIFFESNSYICMFDDRVNFKKALAEFDRGSFFKFILLSYFHSNLLFDQFIEDDFKKSLNMSFGDVAMLSSQNLKALRALSKNAFALNHRFRQVTTEFYFKLLGYPGRLNQALDFDHWEILDSNIQKSILDPLSMAFTGQK